MDIPDIERVVQYMVPLSLSICTQRFGRAGRSGQPAIAILLTEPSAFQTKKHKAKTSENDPPASKVESAPIEPVKIEPVDDDFMEIDEDEDRINMDIEYMKKLEGGMRKWVEALVCRRKVANEYFNNPSSISGKFNSF